MTHGVNDRVDTHLIREIREPVRRFTKALFNLRMSLEENLTGEALKETGEFLNSTAEKIEELSEKLKEKTAEDC